MVRSPSRAGGRPTRLQLTGRGRNHPPRRGYFFPRGCGDLGRARGPSLPGARKSYPGVLVVQSWIIGGAPRRRPAPGPGTRDARRDQLL